MSRTIVFLAAFVAAAAISAQAMPRQAADSQPPGTRYGPEPSSPLPNAYMTVNGRLFALVELLTRSSRLHAARFN